MSSRFECLSQLFAAFLCVVPAVAWGEGAAQQEVERARRAAAFEREEAWLARRFCCQTAFERLEEKLSNVESAYAALHKPGLSDWEATAARRRLDGALRTFESSVSLVRYSTDAWRTRQARHAGVLALLLCGALLVLRRWRPWRRARTSSGLPL